MPPPSDPPSKDKPADLPDVPPVKIAAKDVDSAVAAWRRWAGREWGGLVEAGVNKVGETTGDQTEDRPPKRR